MNFSWKQDFETIGKLLLQRFTELWDGDLVPLLKVQSSRMPFWFSKRGNSLARNSLKEPRMRAGRALRPMRPARLFRAELAADRSGRGRERRPCLPPVR